MTTLKTSVSELKGLRYIVLDRWHILIAEGPTNWALGHAQRLRDAYDASGLSDTINIAEFARDKYPSNNSFVIVPVDGFVTSIAYAEYLDAIR